MHPGYSVTKLGYVFVFKADRCLENRIHNRPKKKLDPVTRVILLQLLINKLLNIRHTPIEDY